ncbi:hypothetical protein E2C01_092676 [Portunus trituberculatus]|uniref:Uncharacterized protein n=1 Tax=Portunus trituberculatus TaxID=210409 RepID=A0A5B7JYD0_PORTR|nr:hypothetical protein [Portunus trituberculatus]
MNITLREPLSEPRISDSSQRDSVGSAAPPGPARSGVAGRTSPPSALPLLLTSSPSPPLPCRHSYHCHL